MNEARRQRFTAAEAGFVTCRPGATTLALPTLALPTLALPTLALPTLDVLCRVFFLSAVCIDEAVFL